MHNNIKILIFPILLIWKVKQNKVKLIIVSLSINQSCFDFRNIGTIMSN